jgi:hypothetical protein
MENLSIFNYSGDGLEVNQAQACRVNMRDVTFSHGGVGIRANNSAASTVMTLDDVRINAMQSHGILATNNTAVFATNVRANRNGLGNITGDGFRAEGNSTINCVNCVSFANIFAGFNAVGGSANIRIDGSSSYNNATGISGNVRSTGNNRFAANGANGAPQPTDITIQ